MASDRTVLKTQIPALSRLIATSIHIVPAGTQISTNIAVPKQASGFGYQQGTGRLLPDATAPQVAVRMANLPYYVVGKAMPTAAAALAVKRIV